MEGFVDTAASSTAAAPSTLWRDEALLMIDRACDDSRLRFVERLEQFIEDDTRAAKRKPTPTPSVAHFEALLYFCAGAVCALAVGHLVRAR